MPDYKHMYFALFGAVADAVELLQQAQREAERYYMEAEEPGLLLLPPPIVTDSEATSRGK